MYLSIREEIQSLRSGDCDSNASGDGELYAWPDVFDNPQQICVGCVISDSGLWLESLMTRNASSSSNLGEPDRHKF